MKFSKSCKYNIMILSLHSFVECRKIPVLRPGLIQLRKRNGRPYIWGGGGYKRNKKPFRNKLIFSTVKYCHPAEGGLISNRTVKCSIHLKMSSTFHLENSKNSKVFVSLECVTAKMLVLR